MNDALFGALFGGGATCVAAWITIRQQGVLSRQEILQSRFADAYVTLQIYISSWADHAKWNLDIIKIASQPEPRLPQVSDIEGARVSLFASDEVVSSMNKFSAAVLSYRLAVGRLEEVRRASSMTGPKHPDLDSVLAELMTSARWGSPSNRSRSDYFAVVSRVCSSHLVPTGTTRHTLASSVRGSRKTLTVLTT